MPATRPRARLFSASRAARKGPAIFWNCAASPGRSRVSAEAPATLGGDGLRLRRFGLGLLDGELAVDRVHARRVAGRELALQEHLGQGVGDLVLDASREWSRAEVRI